MHMQILEHGPRSCKRGVISNLIGHLLPLSLDKYSCRVVQKVTSVSDRFVRNEVRHRELSLIYHLAGC
jgi:hypothetical protein